MLNTIANRLRFTNMNHLVYFVISVSCITITAFCVLTDETLSRSPVLLFMTCLSFLTASFAVYFSLIKKTDGKVFSIDCVWYNSLLGIGYLLLYLTS